MIPHMLPLEMLGVMHKMFLRESFEQRSLFEEGMGEVELNVTVVVSCTLAYTRGSIYA